MVMSLFDDKSKQPTEQLKSYILKLKTKADNLKLLGFTLWFCTLHSQF
jgi:hypothetical protein